MGLGKAIKDIRLKTGLTLQQLEELSGVDAGTIHALEARDSSRSQFFPAIAKAFKMTVEELGRWDSTSVVHAVRVDRDDDSDIPMFSRAPREAAASHGMTPIYAWEHEDDLPPGEFVMVPRLDIKLSAGGGKDQIEIELAHKSPIAFRADWVRSMRLKPNKLAAMTGSGDSMNPTIFDGDLLVINTAATEVVDGKVYGLWYDGGERVKRLFRLPGGGLRIKSDNPQYETIELSPEYVGHVRIIGRVIHRSGTGGL
ncbi:MAG: putative phage repressor [Polaromonas sp.]|nr:putative phage repressor [Polaromonas sp.]